MVGKKSRWQEPEAQNGRHESESLEVAMRSILRMFAEGNLVYRSRETRVSVDVGKSSDRLRRVRQGQSSNHAAMPVASV